MDAFEPLVNLFVVLTVLSVAAERAANLLKLRSPSLAKKIEGDEKAEKQREYQISLRAAVIGIALALVVKADFFEILTKLDSPWSTLGWVRVQTGEWVRAYATGSFGTIVYATLGCVVTGVALGFGSKFWHDALDIVFELRNVATKKTR